MILCVLSIIESSSIEKNGSKFSHLLTVRAEVADSSPPYGQPDRKISAFFLTTSLKLFKFLFTFKVLCFFIRKNVPIDLTR